MPDAVLYSKDGSIVTLTLNEPDNDYRCAGLPTVA